ncbi:MAG: type III-A CRISPR-associated protein Cas10/Csm1, partial [Rhodoferax sp.]|nr:type III-A CRISPR-associated protein Cas10/Csm1 [Rhodoferax sp.]
MTSSDHQLLAASCRVALAGFLHDLGKFAERARIGVAKESLDAHVTQYCPFHATDAKGKNGYHTHRHAAYTGLAFDLIETNAPDLIQDSMWPFVDREALQAQPALVEDSLVNAAAAHHKPKSFLQWVIATADRIASGFDRENFDRYNLARDENPGAATGRNHYQARQLTLFEQISLSAPGVRAAGAGDLAWRYPLAALSPQAIFPMPREQCEPGVDAVAQDQYRALWKEFLSALDRIPASHRSNWPLWLDHFDTAWQTYTHAIPAATAFGVKPEVSLYDHSKTTAALATALWRWHHDNGQIGSAAAAALADRSDWDEDKFLLIQGDFFGIQDFIFADGSQTRKDAARLLRGRSFQVSLFTELAALQVLEALDLPPTSQINNAAGKFLIVAPNTLTVRNRLKEVRQSLNQWFLEHSLGLAGLGLVGMAASGNDFVEGQFKGLMNRLFTDLEKAKLQRFDLTAASNPVFQVDYPLGVCSYNGRLPADQQNIEAGASASLSRDQIKLGTALTHMDRLLITRASMPLTGSGIASMELPIFGYQIALTACEDVTGMFGGLARKGELVRCWDFSLPANLEDSLWNGYARRHINAFVPRFGEIDLQMQGKYSGVDEALTPEAVQSGVSKTFNHLACEDRTCPRNPEHWIGQVALLTLKGDVDNLGKLFQQGLQTLNFAKMAALSRQMNAFFAIWLPAVCAAEFPNTYTVFAGGDDFFLIGPWRSTQKLAVRMAEAFRTYVAQNPEISFSAGMVMTKPGLPMHTLAEQAEEALRAAKGQDKNALVLFGERVRWSDWPKVRHAQEQLDHACATYCLSTGYVYGLLQLVEQASDSSKPEHTMWRSRFAYRTRRYVV